MAGRRPGRDRTSPGPVAVASAPCAPASNIRGHPVGGKGCGRWLDGTLADALPRHAPARHSSLPRIELSRILEPFHAAHSPRGAVHVGYRAQYTRHIMATYDAVSRS